MKKPFGAIPLLGLLLCLPSAGAQTPEPADAINDAPLEQRWAPGEWGPEDRAGAVNRITPELVLRAVGLVRQGKVATLGKTYSADMPLYPGRSWSFGIDNFPPQAAWGTQRGVTMDDHVTSSIGQVGTQFDGPGHIGVRTSKGYFFYNGRTLSDPGVSKDGMGPLGVEHVAQKGFVCRGVLLDAVALRGGRLTIPKGPGADDPGVVTPADIEAMIARQKIAPIREGDCVFINTGHGDLWHPRDWDSYSAEEKDRRRREFMSGQPGLGLSACRYLAERKVILTGADNWMVEASDRQGRGEGGSLIECHVELQTRHGIWNIENLDLSQLVADKAYEFLFVWSPLKIKGGTGSPGNPIAIY